MKLRRSNTSRSIATRSSGKGNLFAFRTARFAMLSIVCLSAFQTVVAQQETDVDPPSVGVTRMIEQIVLPGPLLTHRQVDPKTSPLIVRVVRTFPHGDANRYDISYFGMDAGDFDLRDYLIREDGSSVDDLPPIPVKIASILGGGQVEPNRLETGLVSRLGGYWRLVWIGAGLWALILIAFIFVGRHKRVTQQAESRKTLTLADRLRPSIEAAIAGQLPAQKHAELERMLFAFWEKRLDVATDDPAKALHQVRNHETSGPLLRQIEHWLHSPPQSSEEIDVAQLLAPYQSFDASELDDRDLIGDPSGRQGEVKR